MKQYLKKVAYHPDDIAGIMLDDFMAFIETNDIQMGKEILITMKEDLENLAKLWITEILITKAEYGRI